MSNSSPTEPTAPAGTRPPGPRRRAAALAAATVALLAAAATGCGNGDSTSPAADGKSTPPPSAPAPTPTGTTPGEPSGTTTGTTTAAPATTTAQGATGGGQASGSGTGAQAASARCTVTGLKMTLGRGDPGAGSVYYPLHFTNTTSHTCTLNGFPGVSLLRGDGSVIGKPADRQPVRAAAVRVAPGQTVEADLHTLNQGIKDGGCWRAPTLIMVYPPGSKESMTLATRNPVVCGDTFDVGPVH